MSAASELCEYERQRLANIARNNAMLASLGVTEQKTQIRSAQRAEAGARRRHLKGAQRALTAQADRSRAKSARLSGKPAPQYVEVVESGSRGAARTWVGGQEGYRGGSRSRADHFATGFNNVVWPEKDAVSKAVSAAEKAAEDSAHPASVKVMLPSHVSGGYWLQMPVDLCPHLPGGLGKHRFRLLDEQGDSWPVIWLRRGGSGGGLSGGWRAFAIDHELGVGDVCCFHKQVGNALKATIHRAVSVEQRMEMATQTDQAAGYDTLAPKPQRTAYAMFTKHKRAEMLKDTPQLCGSLADTAKRLGALWRAMGEDAKKPWHEAARKDRARYFEELTTSAAAAAEASQTNSAVGGGGGGGGATPATADNAMCEPQDGAHAPQQERGQRTRASVSAAKRKHVTAAARAAPSGSKRRRSAAGRTGSWRDDDVDSGGGDSDERRFKIDHIVERVVVSGKAFYRVRWRGFAAKDDTLEPVVSAVRLLSCLLCHIDRYAYQYVIRVLVWCVTVPTIQSLRCW
jgi:hypothetical protein